MSNVGDSDQLNLIFANMNSYLLLSAILIVCHCVLGSENQTNADEKELKGLWFNKPEREGRKQSPINLNYCVKRQYPKLRLKGHGYERKGGFELVNTGAVAEIEYSGSAPKMYGGPLLGEYTFKQVHFHWDSMNAGSEHLENSKTYATEMHFVHYKSEYGSIEEAIKQKDGLAVIGLWFELSSKSNDDLDEIISHLYKIKKAKDKTELNSRTMTWMDKFIDEQNYYTYEGSLTTGMFSEIVTWIVLHKKSYISSRQLAQLRKLRDPSGNRILSSRREVQNIGDRTIYCSLTSRSSGSSSSDSSGSR